MKWSNGAFLYKDLANGLPPTFRTLDREGRVISSTTLSIPGVSQFWSAAFDRREDGTVVFAGGAYSAYGNAAPLIEQLVILGGRLKSATNPRVLFLSVLHRLLLRVQFPPLPTLTFNPQHQGPRNLRAHLE